MEHQVTQAESGRRLRDILRQVMGVSYSAMKSAKWDQRILLDGQPARVVCPSRTRQSTRAGCPSIRMR